MIWWGICTYSGKSKLELGKIYEITKEQDGRYLVELTPTNSEWFDKSWFVLENRPAFAALIYDSTNPSNIKK